MKPGSLEHLPSSSCDGRPGGCGRDCLSLELLHVGDFFRAVHLKHILLSCSAEKFEWSAAQPRIAHGRAARENIGISGDNRLYGYCRIENLNFGVETVFLEKARFMGEKDRNRSAAGLRKGDNYFRFLRFYVQFTGGENRRRHKNKCHFDCDPPLRQPGTSGQRFKNLSREQGDG